MYIDARGSEAEPTGATRLSIGAEPLLDVLTSEATATAAASKAPGTRRAYRSDWTRFERGCWREHHEVLPAHPASINHAHRAAGHGAVADHEMVRATLSGIRRTMAASRERPTKRVAPLLVEDLRWASQVTERRDSALL
ncbi:hypothetical protein [Williamsia sp. 1135]|uniref:hypothetical protein n=1 Tax=Williamsia sp. 1135 TaxID=1889262 RepID=UPI000A11BF81|nr:hypothetical protein [Williamsia sp. 1135]ORM38249.1 hypothetical protein BFL43_00510 [Williamsia sp. 1135]